MKELTLFDVNKVARKLIATTGSTTNLDVKNELRKLGFRATQDQVKHFIWDLEDVNNWKRIWNGTYWTYKVPEPGDSFNSNYAPQKFWEDIGVTCTEIYELLYKEKCLGRLIDDYAEDDIVQAALLDENILIDSEDEWDENHPRWDEMFDDCDRLEYSQTGIYKSNWRYKEAKLVSECPIYQRLKNKIQDKKLVNNFMK